MKIKKMPTRKQLQLALDDIEATYFSHQSDQVTGMPREYTAFHNGELAAYFEVVVLLKHLINPNLWDEED